MSPADPSILVTTVPNWDPGDTVMTGARVGYRVIGTDPLDERAAAQGLSLIVVEPV